MSTDCEADVLTTTPSRRLLHERNWRTRAAAVIVANELYECWIRCNVYCISVDGIVIRILTLVEDFQQIESQPKKGFYTSATFNYNVTEFLRDIEELFNIFYNDQKQRRKLEEINKLKMNQDDFAFYEDQIGPRKRKYLDVFEPIDQSDINFRQKIPCSSKSILQQNRVTLKELAIVCERCEVSDRASAAIASATLKAFGIVTEENKDMWWIEASCEEKGKNTEKKLKTTTKNYLN